MTLSDEQRLKGLQTRRRTQIKKKDAFLQHFAAKVGHIAFACKSVGISREAYYRWRRDDEKFNMDCNDVLEANLDFAESSLMQNIKKGVSSDIQFYLRSRGKSRGYGDMQVNFNAEIKTTQVEKMSYDELMALLDRDPMSALK